jgi:hypothetical protein
LDEWIFNFLDLKIRMYKEPVVKEFFSFIYKPPKEKPIWHINKINLKDK